MINKSLLGFFVIAAGAVVAAVTGSNVQETQADTTTQASVTLTMPADSKIAIISMPNIDFGSTEVSTSAKNVQAKSIDAPLSVDNPGFATGWAVDVQAGEFTDSSKNVNLHGAQIKFTGANVKPQVASNVSVAPVAQSVTVASGADAQTLLNADKGTGVGAFDANFGSDNVSLDIPSGNVEGSYSANLTWTLTDSVM
ncbi:WxL domain-containing protein [Lacticaseibacillus hulanensis]|jgi:hypothetical protein|uniref:WxL domain-containing protein n=1 Tax=Lacticaseibacillus hulanensis TaxID=2493111 RepID=UPI000FDBFCAF|nr:WxL domain-containing protein [Lacticaseibacillus hulanensis]